MVNPAETQLTENGGSFILAGDLDTDTVPALFADAKGIGDRDASIDLADVGDIDSSGLALLLHWQTKSQANGKSLEFVNCPEKLRTIAALAGLESGFLA